MRKASTHQPGTPAPGTPGTGAARTGTPGTGVPGTDPRWGVGLPTDRFIPVRIEALVDAIDADPDRFGPLAGWAQKIGRAIDRVVAQEVGELHRHLDRLYAWANPDLDALAEPTPAWARHEQALPAALAYVFERASFTPLSEVGIREAIAAGSAYGLRVRIRPERVRSVSLYVRGRGELVLIKRDPKKPWKRQSCAVQAYRRLAVVARLVDEQGVRLKLFRDIPVADVEALLPHAEATMSALDRAMVVGLGAGSLGSLAKVAFTGAASTGALAIPAAVGLGGMAVRSFFGYRRKKRLRTAHRTEHLYEKNLANNAAVLHTLCRMIAHEESKTALLAYALLCARHARSPAAAWSEETLAEEAAGYLKDRFGVVVGFDASMALHTLQRLGLDQHAALDDPQRALAIVETHWKRQDTIDHHLQAIARRAHQA